MYCRMVYDDAVCFPKHINLFLLSYLINLTQLVIYHLTGILTFTLIKTKMHVIYLLKRSRYSVLCTSPLINTKKCKGNSISRWYLQWKKNDDPLTSPPFPPPSWMTITHFHKMLGEAFLQQNSFFVHLKKQNLETKLKWFKASCDSKKNQLKILIPLGYWCTWEKKSQIFIAYYVLLKWCVCDVVAILPLMVNGNYFHILFAIHIKVHPASGLGHKCDHK